MHIESDGSSAKKIRGAACVFMGLSHLLYLKEYLKGALYALVELVFIALLPNVIIKKLVGLVTLGFPQPDVAVKNRDNSIFMLIDGILVLAIIAIFVAAYVISVRSAEKSYVDYCRTGRFPSQKSSMSELGNRAFPLAGLTPLLIMLLVFVVVPLLFSIAVAFTNYSAPDHIPPKNTVDWVGFQNFKELMGGGGTWSVGFARIAVWTLVWAVLSTFTCYFGGLLVAVILQENKIKFKPVFRFIFILPYAVPSVITMLIWKNLLNGTFGTVNRTLQQIGLLGPDATIPWLGNATLAQIMCIVINLWAGFGYFMMLSMGTMTAIPQDLFEAARIDGAGKGQVLRHITMPLVLYQTMPLIIMSFTHNINNFGIIYFLTGGDPVVADSTTTMAGGTDILVTWIYKLTITLLKYNYASVIAVLIFLVLAPFAVYQFMHTKAYKEGEV
ncbi:MAG TPA: sugar ABC transporter permease [Treponema sp.]|nr:sugar ABC transporter permease [Treponema sp.]HBB42222.1 sugar ABC transporter permease [Treponema sp.]